MLGPGSVINYRSIFLKDQMYVNLSPATDVKVLTLDLDTLGGLVQKHGEYKADGGSETNKAQKERI